LTFSIDPQAVIPWVVKATFSILEVAAKTPTIKRVVLASSSSESYMLFPNRDGRQVGERMHILEIFNRFIGPASNNNRYLE
jgi:hypothetical protein